MQELPFIMSKLYSAIELGKDYYVYKANIIKYLGIVIMGSKEYYNNASQNVIIACLTIERFAKNRHTNCQPINRYKM